MTGGASRRAALALIDKLTEGGLRLCEGGETLSPGEFGDAACLEVVDPRAYAAFLGGGLRAAEAYSRGWWESPDLAGLMTHLARNIERVNRVENGRGGWRRRLFWALERAGMRLFSRSQARRHVRAHYDLPAEFFALFLDANMAYSCAVFDDGGGGDLEAAQVRKMEALCRALDLREGDTFLDLGCGWGSLAMHAAERHGCQTTALTLSARQFAHVRARLRERRLEGRVEALRMDYRELTGRRFSKIASVEMIEAVGVDKFGEYFRVLRRLLADGGRAAVQSILIPRGRYAGAAREADFISRHIFPGGGLPSEEVIRGESAAAGLRLCAAERIGRHYAPTLAEWRRRFRANLAKIRGMGFDDGFCRMWDYYFCYCQGGFAAEALDNAQFVFCPAR